MKCCPSIAIIGGGLAGCEAAWQLSKRGHRVILHEMKPSCFSPAHTSPYLAELVCSNSLRSNIRENAAGLLKEEMRHIGSLIMEAADANSIPAGTALAVDRIKFSRYVEEKLFRQPNLEIVRGEVKELPHNMPVIVATGPLTSPALAQCISDMTNSEHLYFYDSIAPVILGESINYDKIFRASRYDAGEGDYVNCPIEQDLYDQFWKMLCDGKEVPLKEFEEFKCFEGCLPIEVMAKRGKNTLAFGPMKPVGLIDPKTGRRPYAVVQLRRENALGTLYNMVGFQTKLTWSDQARIFRTIPGLEKAEFLRYGSMHRNTFINSPVLLKHTLQLRHQNNIFFAGQITGVEGYIESTAMGLTAGISAHFLLSGKEMQALPETTAHGALIHYITSARQRTFQPMNVNFGIFPPLSENLLKKDRKNHYAVRALTDLNQWLTDVKIG